MLHSDNLYKPVLHSIFKRRREENGQTKNPRKAPSLRQFF